MITPALDNVLDLCASCEAEDVLAEIREIMYLNDAGMFGAGEVQRSNFAGRMQGGGPIYTGR